MVFLNVSLLNNCIDGILVNDGLVLISKFNSNLRDGMSFDDSIFNAGLERLEQYFLHLLQQLLV